MNRYLVINEGIIVDVVEYEESFDSSLTEKEFDTVQIDNDNTHNIGDVFELNKVSPQIYPYSVDSFTKLGAVDKYEIAIDNATQNIYIGCTSFVKDTGVVASRTQWESFTDEEVEVMDNGALVWWKKYKSLVMQLLDVNGIK